MGKFDKCFRRYRAFSCNPTPLLFSDIKCWKFGFSVERSNWEIDSSNCSFIKLQAIWSLIFFTVCSKLKVAIWL